MHVSRNAVRRAERAALSFGAALALITGFSAEAQAANGTLSFKDTDGIVHERANPTDGVCFSFTKPAVSVDNFTDTNGRLFTGSLCEESTFLIDIFKGTSLVFGGTKPMSAKLGG